MQLYGEAASPGQASLYSGYPGIASRVCDGGVGIGGMPYHSFERSLFMDMAGFSPSSLVSILSIDA